LAKLAGYYVGDWGPGFDLIVEDGKLVSMAGGARVEASFFADGRFYLGAPSNALAPRPDGSLETESLGGLAAIHRPAPRVTPSTDGLAALAGDYRCDELDVTYTLTPSEGGLVLSSLRAPPMPLAPADEDHFEGVGVRLGVMRGAHGESIGFSLSTGRVRGLEFRRL
jgi:hypothetical protein